MNKTLRVLVAVVMMAAAIALTGCGSDKYVGKWINTDGFVKELTIEKNGDNYLVTPAIYRYYGEKTVLNQAEIDANKLNIFDMKPSYKKITPICDFKYTWVKSEMPKVPAVMVNKQLTIKGNTNIFFVAGMPVTYIEKESTLTVNNYTYKKETADDVENARKKNRQAVQDYLDGKTEQGKYDRQFDKINKVEYIDKLVVAKD